MQNFKFQNATAFYGSSSYPLTAQLFPAEPDLEGVKRALLRHCIPANMVAEITETKTEAMPEFGIPEMVQFHNDGFSVIVAYAKG